LEQVPKIAIIGGGASGVFCAINIKGTCPKADVTVFEAGIQPLHKLAMTGGGRCNITNTFEDVKNLQQVYPRGYNLLKKLFHEFDHNSTAEWFARHGIQLYAQDDHRMFPTSNSAAKVCETLLSTLNKLGVWMLTGRKATAISVLDDGRFSINFSDGNDGDDVFDAVVIATGGWHKDGLYESLETLGIEMIEPVPSLFSLKVKSNILTNLMGASVENAVVQIPGQKFRAEGGLLVTHFGFSGPAVLKLSSYAARHLADNNYKCDLLVNWLGVTEDAARTSMSNIMDVNARKSIISAHPRGLTQRLWEYLIARAEIDPTTKYGELGKKNLNKLINTLTADIHHISGRGQFKDEFVTCGGVSLNAVNSKTLESKTVPHLYFTGEALDIDAITGGYNLQGCWTTGAVVAKTINKYFILNNELNE